MQLLKITSTPMKYKLEVENAKLEYQQDVTPSCDITTTPSQLSIRSESAQIQIDTYEARKSLGLVNIADSIKQYAAKGREHISALTQEYVQIGKAMGEIQNGADIGDIVTQKMLQQPVLYTTFLPSAAADISCVPGNLEINYQPSNVNLDWQIKDNSFSYQPGSVSMKIVEYAHVDIEYLGGPIYVPPSADPDYIEPEKN